MTRKVELLKPIASEAASAVFITGTGTGVGKTVLTGLLLAHLRSIGAPALALKPFCSGSRNDAEVLHSLQDSYISLDEINPFYFPRPLAPYVAASFGRPKGPQSKASRRTHSLSLAAVVTWMNSVYHRRLAAFASNKAAQILVEGSGGVLVPLGKDFSVLDLISALADRVIVVAPNILGTLNHSLLTVRALQQAGLKRISLVLMDARKPDLSARSNAAVLSELLPRVPVHSVPFLEGHCRTANDFISHALRLQPILAEILGAQKANKIRASQRF